MDELLDLGRRRADHRPHRRAQGRPDSRAAQWEGPPMTDPRSPSASPTCRRCDRRRAAEGLELVRLGQLGLLHDRAQRAVRAVHDHRRRAGPPGCVDADETCTRTVNLLGLHLAAGSLPFYLTSFATIASAFVLPIVGAFVDRSSRKKLHMAASPGPVPRSPRCCSSCTGDNWQLGAVAVVVSSILAGLLPGQLLRDPGATSPPRTSATGSPRAAGPGATSAVGCCCCQPGHRARCTTRSG